MQFQLLCVYRRENGLSKALEKDQAGVNLKNRFGGLIWSCSQITLSSLSTCRQEGQMLRNGLRVPKPVPEEVKFNLHALAPGPMFLPSHGGKAAVNC